MTKKIQESKSLSKKTNKQPKNDSVGRPKRERIADLVTEKDKRDILALCMKKAREGDVMMLKSMQEQIWGRPVATLEAKVDANIDLTMITYGQGTDTV